MAKFSGHKVLSEDHFEILIRPDRITGGRGEVQFADGSPAKKWSSDGHEVTVDVGNHRSGKITERKGRSDDYNIPEIDP